MWMNANVTGYKRLLIVGINEICRWSQAPLHVFHAVRRVRRSGAEQEGKRKQPALVVQITMSFYNVYNVLVFHQLFKEVNI